jgi:hypothetical protein
MILSLSEIIKKAAELKSNQEKIEWLRKNDSQPLRTVLKYTYDKTVEFLVPNTPPPWKKNSYVGVEGMLLKEARRLRIFVKGGGYDELNQVKRENLFISLLEDVDNSDAELLCKMIAQKPLTGLPRGVIVQSFPGLIEGVKEEQDGKVV